MKRSLELVRGRVPVAIEEESDQQTQYDLDDAFGERATALQGDYLRSRQQPRQFLEPHRAALVQVLPIVGDTAADQRNARDPVGRTWRALMDEFLTCRDQSRYVIGQRSSKDRHRYDDDQGQNRRGDQRRQRPSSAE